MFNSIKLVLIIGLIILTPVSWIKNAYHLTQADFEPSYKEEIIGGVAIFVVPISIVTAWIDIGDEAKK